MVTAADYTTEQLLAAWRTCRLPSWPPSFDAAMADPARQRLIVLHAWLDAHPRKAKATGTATAPVPCPAPSARPLLFLSHPPGYVDHKRAAAGDRDD
jgi:hypothetical protein